MSDRLKQLFASSAFLLMIFTQSLNFKNLFPIPTSLTEKSIVQGIGSDTAKENKIALTAASKAVSPSGNGQSGGGGEEKKSIIFSETGDTFFDAFNKTQSFSDKTLLLDYLDIVVIGEDAAKKDLLSHIEYLYTDPKMRMDLLIFVAKNSTAEEVLNINSIGSETVSEKLVSLINNIDKNSFVNPVTFYDIIAKMEDRHLYSNVPAVEIIKNGTEEGKSDVKLAGYALFKEKSLLCYLDENQSRALNIISGEFKKSPFVIKNSKFGLVTVEIFNIKSEIKYIPDDKYGKFEIAVNTRSNFAEQYKQADTHTPYSPDGVLNLEETMSREIERQLGEFISYSKEIKTDIAELSSAVKQKHPKKWKEFESTWDEIYSEIPVTIKVDSRISNFFTLHNQIGVDS